MSDKVIFNSIYLCSVVLIEYGYSGYWFSVTLLDEDGVSRTHSNEKMGEYDTEQDCWKEINWFIREWNEPAHSKYFN